ncbi:myosin heavy chain, cardiac muscle isoform-like [Paramacrobiotus metropolitanus]|uniref:myosin heavy chain, cardiac muscle isoform-like n=1 Tax=Paramacrobiotus metropolitanus TaxID=2943436 RepID=UPI002445FD22|nr:myosin heavy chain, cardiac muscle isoform-like [Paramacrobiotus metropolitanus]
MSDTGKKKSRAIIKIDPKILALYAKGPYDASNQKRFKFNVDVIPLELMYRELGIEVPDIQYCGKPWVQYQEDPTLPQYQRKRPNYIKNWLTTDRCIPEPYIKEYVTDEEFKAAAQRALEKVPEFKKEIEARKQLANQKEKTPQGSEPSTRSAKEQVADTVINQEEKSAPKEAPSQPDIGNGNEPISVGSLIDFNEAMMETEDDHSSDYESPASKLDDVSDLPRMKIVRTGDSTFHASQVGLQGFLTDKDFEFTDEEFMEQAASVDDRLATATTEKDLEKIARESLPFLLRGIRRIVAQAKIKLDSIGESKRMDQLLQEEKQAKLKFQSDFNEMRKRCETACKERDTALYRNRSLNESLDNYRENAAKDKKEYEKLLEEYQQLKDDNRNMENAMEELRREYDAIKSSRNSKVDQQANADLQKQNHKLAEQASTLRRELQQQRDAYTELSNKNRQDTNLIESLRRQVSEEQKRINPDVDYVAQLQEELAMVKSQNEMYLSSSRAATAAVSKDREETLLATIEQYKAEIATEKAEKEKLQKERRVNKACTKCAELEKEAKEAQAAAYLKQTEVDRLRTESDQCRITIHNLQQHLHNGEAAYAELQEEVRHYRNQAQYAAREVHFEPEAPVGTGDDMPLTHNDRHDQQTFAPSEVNPSYTHREPSAAQSSKSVKRPV